MNTVLETHDRSDTDLGKSILVALPKPNKPKGPAANLRPINLLNICRKILSKITLKIINSQVDEYLSQSQSAYRQGRSTSDIVFAHRLITAKVQKYQGTEVFITGIDMSSAFDTIHRHKLIDEIAQFKEEDELRMCRLLLSETSITIRNTKAKPTPFKTNIGSPKKME